jgi:hypothetical protein
MRECSEILGDLSNFLTLILLTFFLSARDMF